MGFPGVFKRSPGGGKEDETEAALSADYRKFLAAEEEEKRLGGLFGRACRFSERILNIRAPGSFKGKLDKALLILDMNITADQVFSLSVLALFASLIGIVPAILFLTLEMQLALIAIPFLLFYYIISYPAVMAEITKIRAADESVKVILYMVIYLRLNPNMEGALKFSARHCSGPFGRDLRKILWDLEMGKYRTIEQAFTSKMKKWIEWDKDFLEAFQALMNLSMIVSEQKRQENLEDALGMILDRTYAKMKEYGKALRTPTMFIHTMGITFPILGLIMFPLASIFLSDSVNPWYIALGYTVALPLFLLWYMRRTIAKRPSAFSWPDISEHPDLPPEGMIAIGRGNKRTNIPILPISILILFVLAAPGASYMYNLANDYFSISASPDFAKQWESRVKAEYEPAQAMSSIVYSLTIIWGVAFSLAFYFYGKSFQRVKIRSQIKQLESEFVTSLQRLSDVLSTNMPIETSMEAVASKYKQYGYESSPMYLFFTSIISRMKKMGQTLEQAIFDKKYGVILQYPSKLILDVMQFIVSSAKKGPKIVAVVTKSISTFLKSSRDVEEQIADILDETVSGAKMQASFVAPLVCGIVAGTAVLIIQLLHLITKFIDDLNSMLNLTGTTGSGNFLSESILGINSQKIIPPSVFQMIIGIYMMEVVILLGFFLNGLQNGFDKNMRNYVIGKYLLIATVIYSAVLIAMVAFFAPVMYQIMSMQMTTG